MAETEAPVHSSVDVSALADAYLYLLGRALVVRQEMMDRGGEEFAFNRVQYNPLGSADFVNPNFDVAYLEAWIAVPRDAVKTGGWAPPAVTKVG